MRWLWAQTRTQPTPPDNNFLSAFGCLRRIYLAWSGVVRALPGLASPRSRAGLTYRVVPARKAVRSGPCVRLGWTGRFVWFASSASLRKKEATLASASASQRRRPQRVDHELLIYRRDLRVLLNDVIA
jgi:hypothetical protein